MARLRFFIAALLCTAGTFAASVGFDLRGSETGLSGPVTNEVTVGNWGTIAIRSDFPQGYIFYTLDGSAPSAASTPYNQPFVVRTNTTVRAIAYSSNLGESGTGQLLVRVVPAYNLRVVSNPDGLVSVNPDHRPPGNPPGDHGYYISNSVVTLTASERSGLIFVGWLGDASGPNRQISVLMDAHKNITARYVSRPVVTVPAGGGRVEVVPSAVGIGEFARITAIPDPGRFFARWGGDVSGNQNPSFVYMHMPEVPVSALFAPLESNQVSFTAVLDGPAVLVKPRTNVLPRGEIITVEADLKPAGLNPLRAQRFLGWSGTHEGFENPLTLTLAESTLLRGQSSAPEVDIVRFENPLGDLAAPVVGADGTVYLSVSTPSSHYLNAYTPSLELKWSTNTGLSRIGLPSIGDGGTIYAGGANGDVVAVSPAGQILWRFSSGEPVSQNVSAVTPSLSVAADDTIYSSSVATRNVYVSRNGTLVRTIPPYEESGVARASIPVIGPDGTIYVPTAAGYTAQTPDGQVKWFAAHPRPIALDAAGKLYSLRGGEIIALDFAGTNLWTAAIPAGGREIVIAQHGTLFTATEAGVVAVSSNGVVLWTNRAGGNLVVAKSDGGVLVVTNSRPAGYVLSTLKNIAADGRDSWMEQWWEHSFDLFQSRAAIAPSGEIYQVLHLSRSSSEAEIYHTSGEAGPAHSSWPGPWGTRNTGRAVIPAPPASLMIAREGANLVLRANGLSKAATLEMSADLRTWTEVQPFEAGQSVTISPEGDRYYRLRID